MAVAMYERLRIDQIAVTFDAASENELALSMAAQMAKMLGAKLHGVFVEDPGLLLAISQPITRHVTTLAGSPIDLDLPTMEAHFTTLRNRLRDALHAVALESQVAWSFLTVRQNPARVSVNADLLIIQMSTRSAAGQWRPVSRLVELAYRGTCPVLLVRHGLRHHCVVTLVIEALSPTTARALNWAVNIAGEHGHHLRVLVGRANLAKSMIVDWLRTVQPEAATTVQISHMRPGVAFADIRELVGQKGDLLVIDAATDLGNLDQVRALVLATQSDVLLVR